MKIYNQLINKLKDQRGGVAIIVAIIVVFIVIALMALAIDVGRLYGTKNELQNVADAAALAGAGKLGDIYTHMTAAEQDAHDFSTDRADIVLSARGVVGAGNNKVAGEDITINEGDIFIYNVTLEGGNLKYEGSDHFVLGDPSTMPDAVRVKVRRDDTSGGNGPITTFFAKMLGFGTINVTADATAALTTLDEVGSGEMNMPIGLSENMFPNDCTDTIKFSPTADSCAAWHNFFDPVNASTLPAKLLGLILDDPTVHDDDPTNDPDPYGQCALEPCGRTDPNDAMDQSWLDVYFNMLASQVPDSDYTMDVDGGEDSFDFQGGVISALFTGGRLDWEADANGDYVIPKYNIPGDSTSGQVVLGDDKHPASFFAIFDYMRFRDGIDLPLGGLDVDADDDPTTGTNGNEMHITDSDAVWSALVPVYEDNDVCINPNSALKIVGFAVIHVVMPNAPPASTITAKIDCNLTFIGGQGGGGFSGNVRGTIPNLVE